MPLVLVRPRDEIWLEFEQRHPSARHYKEPRHLTPERLRIRQLREQNGISRNAMDTLCGFKRGVTRRFEDSCENMTLKDRRHLLAMTQVIDGRRLPVAV
jgi:hypothetical protein